MTSSQGVKVVKNTRDSARILDTVSLKSFILLAAFAAMGICTSVFSEGQGPGKLGLVINEDNSHFYGTRAEKDLTIEGLHAFVDQYAGTAVSHLFLCPNAMRTSYASDVWDAIWELGEQEAPSGVGKRWMDNARILHERGLDPYAVWIARCREKGLSPWLSMRMNDVHDVMNEKSFMHSTFWVEHPEYWRVPGSTSGWVERALDYGIPEVREHHLALIRELLSRYDPDGLELDWMRFGYHFKPGEEAEGCAILTNFMREVRDLTREWSAKRGHAINVSARVPTHPDAAKGLGMDGITWAQEGLVDMLVPTPFWAASDFDIPLELWRERLGEVTEDVVLAAGLEHNLRAYPGGATIPNDLESARGFAASAWRRGADQIYLFNYMDSGTIPVSERDYRILIEQGLGPEVVSSLSRRHIQAYRDTVPAGFPNGVALPAEASEGASFRLHTGRAPEAGSVHFIVGLAKREEVGKASFRVHLNGADCTSAADCDTAGRVPGAARAIQFKCPFSALTDGYNEVFIKQAEGTANQAIVWAEIRIVPATGEE